MRNNFIDTIAESCHLRDDLIILSGDAGLGVFDELKISNPDRFINMGVAEQNMTSFAAGLALTGFKVYLYNIIPFLLYRCYEQVRNDICDQELPVVFVGIGSGITYAPAGISHYSIEDIGLARTLPNLTVISPIDPVEAKAAAKYSLQAENPVYVRIAKSREPLVHDNVDIDITVPQKIRDGADVALVFHGSISEEVMDAYDQLVKYGIHPMLISVPMLQPLNREKLFDMLKDITIVLSVEEHFENSGLGSILASLSAEYSPSWKLKTKGISYNSVRKIQDRNNLRKYFGISAGDIVKAVKDMVHNG